MSTRNQFHPLKDKGFSLWQTVFVLGVGGIQNVQLLLYVEALIFILETLEKLGIYYRIMLVLLLFMHLLVVD